MAKEFRLLQPSQYHQQFLSQNIRIDGRTFDSYRPILLNSGSISTSDGSSLIKLGNTSVICGIKSELTEPNPETPNKGIVNVTVNLPPLCSSKYHPYGNANSDEFILTQFINDIIKNNEIVKLESLCVIEKKYVWSVNLEVICLNYDGNLFDSCLTTVLAALKCGSLPNVKINDNGEVSYENTRIPIEVNSFPIANTFIFIDDKILCDPNSEEEALAHSILTIVINADDDSLSLMHKPGGASISRSQIEICYKKAKERSKHIKSLIIDCINSISKI